MIVEILTEDKSGAYVVHRLTRKLLENWDVPCEIKIRPHRGCGSFPKDLALPPPRFCSSLLDLLPAKLRAYNKVYGGKDAILIIIMDSDNNDPKQLRSSIYKVASMYAPDIKTVVGLCTEEIEAWLLGDFKAISMAYPNLNEEAYEDYVQDSICGTWEKLCEVVCPENYDELIDIGYPAIGHYKARWAKDIAEFMEPENNISGSFITYKNALEIAIHGRLIPNSKFHQRSF